MQNIPIFSQYSYIPHRMKHSRRSRAIYTVLLLAICMGMVSLFFITVDVSVQCRGVITTANRQSSVVSATYGKVLRSTLEENSPVTIGDVLVVIDTTEVSQSIALTQSRITLLEQELLDLRALTANRDLRVERRLFSTSKYKQEFKRMRAELGYQQAEVEILEKEYNRQKILHSQNVVADVDLEQSKHHYQSAELKWKQMVEAQLATWQGELLAITNQLLTLRETVNSLQKERNKCFITAPVSGFVQGLIPLSEGTVVFANQQLCSISPSDGLLVETYISPSDIGFIHEGQEVMLRIDAFSSNQWGTLPATVTEIANDITSTSEQIVGFRVLCDMLTQKLYYGERTAQVKKGMTLTANYVLSQRTLAQLLFDDMNKWINPNIIAE